MIGLMAIGGDGEHTDRSGDARQQGTDCRTHRGRYDWKHGEPS